jgi:hypothetical protein
VLTGAIQADEATVGDAGPLGVGGRAVGADLGEGGEREEGRGGRAGGERVGRVMGGHKTTRVIGHNDGS